MRVHGIDESKRQEDADMSEEAEPAALPSTGKRSQTEQPEGIIHHPAAVPKNTVLIRNQGTLNGDRPLVNV